MAKKYTQAQWSRIQSRLPESDRIPYSQSPEVATPLEQLQQSVQRPTVDPYYVRDPKTGLSPAQVDALAAQNAAKTGAAQTATQLGLTVNPKTGMIDQPTGMLFDPATGKFVNRPIVEEDDNADLNAELLAAEDLRRAGQSAYALLFAEFERYGLGALVEPLKGFITDGLSPAEFTLKLRETDAYKKRFAANASRIQKGLRALSEAEYIGLEDSYQNIMRQYGLPESYYTRGDLGRQEGFEKFIAADVSPVELEDRIGTAYNRVTNANPEVAAALREFYPDITNGDILAYALDPQKGLTEIKRKVTAAEIGGAAKQFGLGTSMARAEELGQYGVTKQQAQQGFETISEVLPRGSFLADVYKTGPYTQAVAEAEVFSTPGSTEARARRRKLTELEQASFAGSSGAAQGALARDRAGAF